MIIEGKSYTFKNLEIKFIIKTLAAITKTVYIIECNKCKGVYIGSTHALNTRISFRKSSIKIPENKKLSVSKHLSKSSHRKFKTMTIYQTNNYTLH